MTLAARLLAFVQAVGADIKQLTADVDALQAAGGGGGSAGYTLIGSFPTTSGTSFTFADIPTTYGDLVVEFDGVSFASGNTALQLKISADGATFSTGAVVSTFSSSTFTFIGSILIPNYRANNGAMLGFTLGGTSSSPQIVGATTELRNTVWKCNGGIKAIQLVCQTGSVAFDAGTVKLWGR